MLGQLRPALKKTTVIGAGLSGLMTTYKLAKAGHEVNLYERSGRVGGLINTIETPYGPAETAAHSIRATPEIAHFLEDLGVPMLAAKTAKRAIFRNGTSRPWPLTPIETLGLIRRLVTRKIRAGDTALGDFGRHHLGATTTTNLLQPMANGIFASDVNALDRRAAFPDFKPKAGDTLLWHLIKGAWRTRTQAKPKALAPQRGMGDLVKHLENAISAHPNCQLHLNSSLEIVPDLATQNVIFATPASATADILRPSLPEVGRLLDQVRYQPLLSVTVFYKGTDLARVPYGIGVLNSEESQAKSLGILYNSNTFDGRTSGGENLHSFTFIFGGDHFAQACDFSDQMIEQAVEEEAALILHATAKPIFLQASRWKAAIPTLSPTLFALWENLPNLLPPGLCLYANYTGDYSIRQMIQRKIYG